MNPGRKLMLLVERVSGIVLPDRELERLTDWAQERAELKGFKDTNAYVEELRRKPESGEWRLLLSRVTVKESSLFRAPQQFRCVRDSIIPELLAAGRNSIRVWSAGCARGEEPTTIAVVLSECLSPQQIQWSILGTDVDSEALERARRATFSQRSVRRVPKEDLEKYFSVKAGSFELKPGVLSRLEFLTLNLIQETLEVPGQPFDIIFLRNVLIYFRRESQVRVLRNIQKKLAPGGFLLVGPSESLMDLAPGLRAEERQGVFVYRLRDEQRDIVGADTGDSPVPNPNQERGPEELKGDQLGEMETHNLEVTKPSPASYVLQGHQAENRGDIRTALRCYRAALYLQPNFYQVRYRLGCCLQIVGWPVRARAEFRATFEILRRGSEVIVEVFQGSDFPGRKEIEAACIEAIQTDDGK